MKNPYYFNWNEKYIFNFHQLHSFLELKIFYKIPNAKINRLQYVDYTPIIVIY